MTRESFISASADRDHDLELIAVLDQGFLMQAARDDRAVLLHGDLLAGERHLLDQRADRERGLEALRGAVDRHLDHFESTMRYSPSITRPPAAGTRTERRPRHQAQVQARSAAATAP